MTCSLCSAPSRETVLVFHHVRKAERVTLEIALCETCGNNIEKHLKRAIPKRLMEFTLIERLLALQAAEPVSGVESPLVTRARARRVATVAA